MADSLSGASGIVFDLDGTLVDSTYVHTLCWWQALQQFGHQRPMAAVHRAVGMGANALFDQVLGGGRDTRRDAAIIAAHDALFATWHDRIRPLPAARSLLDWCRDAGLTVGLAFPAGEKDLWPMLDVLDQPDFDVVVTADDVVVTADDVEGSGPNSQILAAVLGRAGLSPDDVLVVGDHVCDVRAACGLGATALGVATGGTSGADLVVAGAARSFPDLLSLLHALQLARPCDVDPWADLREYAGRDTTDRPRSS